VARCAVYRNAEDAAKRELLAGSAQLAEPSDLESAVAAAKAKANAKTAELNRAFAEFNGIPDKSRAHPTSANELRP